jgi:hypothetical protein
VSLIEGVEVTIAGTRCAVGRAGSRCLARVTDERGGNCRRRARCKSASHGLVNRFRVKTRMSQPRRAKKLESPTLSRQLRNGVRHRHYHTAISYYIFVRAFTVMGRCAMLVDPAALRG